MRSTRLLGMPTVTAAVFLLMIVSGCFTFTLSEAKRCEATNAMTAWKHHGGMFRKVPSVENKGTYVWTEYSNDGEVQATFEETMRDVGQQQLLLSDPKRGVTLLLRHDLCGIRGKDEDKFNQLYSGKWMRVADCT